MRSLVGGNIKGGLEEGRKKGEVAFLVFLLREDKRSQARYRKWEWIYFGRVDEEEEVDQEEGPRIENSEDIKIGLGC